MMPTILQLMGIRRLGGIQKIITSRMTSNLPKICSRTAKMTMKTKEPRRRRSGVETNKSFTP